MRSVEKHSNYPDFDSWQKIASLTMQQFPRDCHDRLQPSFAASEFRVFYQNLCSVCHVPQQ
jgi:hypothetical protein